MDGNLTYLEMGSILTTALPLNSRALSSREHFYPKTDSDPVCQCAQKLSQVSFGCTFLFGSTVVMINLIMFVHLRLAGPLLLAKQESLTLVRNPWSWTMRFRMKPLFRQNRSQDTYTRVLISALFQVVKVKPKNRVRFDRKRDPRNKVVKFSPGFFIRC